MLLRGSLLNACRDFPRSPNLEDYHSGSAFVSKPAVDIATAQPIMDADAPVIVFMSVRNLLSDSTKYWRSMVILSAPFLSVAR
ncbi:hypothetical protein Tco_0470046, partial [Tanacetum coccineum]